MKKIITLLTVAAMAVSIFAGCGENNLDKSDGSDVSKTPAPPTAEELVAGAYPADLTSMKADLSVSYEGLMVVEEESASMEMSADMKVTMESDVDTMLVKGNATIEIFGMTVEQEVEEYVQLADGTETTYSYNKDDDAWTYVEMDSDKESYERKLDLSMFKDLEVKEEDESYVVTGTMNMSNMEGSVGMNVEDLVGSMEDNENKMDAVITFDKETKNLKSMKLTLSQKISVEGMDITKFDISMENVVFSTDNVEIPATVIEVAKNEYDTLTEIYEDPMLDEDDGYNEQDSLTDLETPDTDDTAPADEDGSENVGDEDVDSAHAGDDQNVGGHDSAGAASIAEKYFGVLHVYAEDLDGKFSSLDAESVVMDKLLTFINGNSKYQFLGYMYYWDIMTDDEKLAAAYVEKLGVVTADEMAEAGVDAEELAALVDSIS